MRTRRFSMRVPVFLAFLLALGIGPAVTSAEAPATSSAKFGHHAEHV